MKKLILSILPILGIQLILNAQPFSATIHDDAIITNAQIKDFKEDAQGNVWFAGKKLLRYDGSEFVDMGFPNCSTSNCYINSIFFDAQGTLWLTGKGIGLNKFENNQFVKIDGPSDIYYADVFESYEYQRIVVDKMGRIYAVMANISNGYQNHVFWDGSEWSEPNGGAVNNDFEKYQDIKIDNGDTVYIRLLSDFEFGLGDDFYYYSYDFTNLSICCTPADIKPQADGSVLMLINGNAGDFNIVKKAGQNWSVAQTPSTTSNMIPVSLEVDINGRTWVTGFNTSNNKLRLGYVDGQQINFVTAAELELSALDVKDPKLLATSKNKLWLINLQGTYNLVEIHLDGVNAAQELSDKKSKFASCEIYPNPTSSGANIQFQLNSSTEVSYEVFNALGKIVASEQLGFQLANGMKKIELPILKPGVFFVKLNADGQILYKKLQVSN